LFRANKVGGTAKLLLGFVVGALVTLGALRYIPSMREAALTHANGTAGSAERLRGSASASPDNSIASRLSYDLSRLPDETRRPPPAAQAESRERPAVATTVPPPPSAAQAPAAEPPVSTERILNARPINPIPPDPRDRTREIQKEAQNPAYREPRRSTSAPVGKVFEGRDIQIQPKAPEPAAGATRLPATGATGSVSQTESLTVSGKEVAPAPAAKPVDPAPPGATSAPADAVESRFQATREWLGSAAQTTHTIQLLGSPSEAQLKTHLLVLSKVLEPGKLYVFRTMAQGKPSITVAYGEYPDRKAALHALDDLPSSAAAYQPVLRTVNGIRAELKQHGLE
jgi:septal ring-binding cell division protein DamX